MKRVGLVLAALCLAFAPAQAHSAKPASLKKEPTYKTKAPRYALLLFGPEGKHHVWLVRDGSTLYVDRNGDGDLTEPGKKVAAEESAGHDPADDGLAFQAGDITVGGEVHKALSVYFIPLKIYSSGELGKRADVKAALAHDPKAMAVRMMIDVAVPGIHGGGLGGRVSYEIGPVDLNGVFQFAHQPAEAPAVQLGGPLEVSFYAERPILRVGRSNDCCLVVGTPGIGPGTFAMVQYQGTIPREARPVVEAHLPAAKPGAPPVKMVWVIKSRC